ANSPRAVVPGLADDRRTPNSLYRIKGRRRIFLVLSDGKDRAVCRTRSPPPALRSPAPPVSRILRKAPHKLPCFPGGRELRRHRTGGLGQSSGCPPREFHARLFPRGGILLQ